jgi:hypothetical protein
LPYITTKGIAAYSASYGNGGDPEGYTISGKSIAIFPTALDATPPWQYVIDYVAEPVLDLAQDTNTNDILVKYPGIYLYGTLVHSAPYLDEDPRIPVWAGKYAELIQKVNTEALYSSMGTPQISMPRP